MSFVSISGVSNSEELKGIHNICKEEFIGLPVVIGYQVSNKSINQGTKNSRQPKFLELGELDNQTRDYGLITAIHYYTKNNETTQDDLERVVEAGVDPSKAFIQFNTLPLSPEELRKTKEIGYRVIFKVAVSGKGGYAVWKGKGVEEVSSGRVDPLVQQVRERNEFIDYVMFDPSHGTNLDLDLDRGSLAVRFGEDLVTRAEFDRLGLVYAGGIKPGNVGNVTRSLLSFLPKHRISVDIESGVRTDDRLDLEKVRDYLVNYMKCV